MKNSILKHVLIGTVLLVLSFAAGAYGQTGKSQAVDFYNAVKKGDLAKTKKFLEQGADPNTIYRKDSMLKYAIERGHTDIAKLLLGNSASPGKPSPDYSGQLPLTAAVMKKNLDIVKLLIEKGADINASVDKGDTAIICSATKDSVDIMKYLIESGADVNAASKYGNTALNQASQYGSKEAVKLLLDKGAKVNHDDQNADCPVVAAAKRGKFDNLELLATAGADLNRRCKFNKKTPLMYAAGRGHPNMVNFLIKTGAALDLVDEDNRTALIIGTRTNKFWAVKPLIEAGADVHLKDKDGNSALMIAKQNDSHDISQALLKAGAKLDDKTAAVLAQKKIAAWAKQKETEKCFDYPIKGSNIINAREVCLIDSPDGNGGRNYTLGYKDNTRSSTNYYPQRDGFLLSKQKVKLADTEFVDTDNVSFKSLSPSHFLLIMPAIDGTPGDIKAIRPMVLLGIKRENRSLPIQIPSFEKNKGLLKSDSIQIDLLEGGYFAVLLPILQGSLDNPVSQNALILIGNAKDRQLKQVARTEIIKDAMTQTIGKSMKDGKIFSLLHTVSATDKWHHAKYKWDSSQPYRIELLKASYSKK